MGIYRYAANRAALLDGVTELVLNELTLFPDDADWQAQLRRIAHDLREIALRHPNIVPLLVTRPLSTPLGFRPCQWPIVCAHGRPAKMPAGGHENCPLMATRSAHRVFGGVGHVGVWV